ALPPYPQRAAGTERGPRRSGPRRDAVTRFSPFSPLPFVGEGQLFCVQQKSRVRDLSTHSMLATAPRHSSVALMATLIRPSGTFSHEGRRKPGGRDTSLAHQSCPRT